MSNAIILAQLLAQYGTKILEIGALFRNAQGGDVTDEQVNASAIARDVEIARAQGIIDLG